MQKVAFTVTLILMILKKKVLIMGLSLAKIKLLKFIQEANQISLEKCGQHFDKDICTIRRDIQDINDFCKQPIIQVKKSICSCPLSYQEYLQVIKKLTNYDYFSSYDERLRVVICKIFFDGFANTTELYTLWNLSLTTKKNDMVKFRKLMTELSMKVDIMRKKGLRVSGNDLLFRIYVTNQIYSLIEIKDDTSITERIANTPLEHQIYEMIDENYKNYIPKALKDIQNYLDTYHLSITYSSKKMLLLFLCCLYFLPPKEDMVFIQNIPFPHFSTSITPDPFFNEVLGVVISILDLSRKPPYIFERKLEDICNQFIDEVEQAIHTSIYTKEELKQEVYSYVQKGIAQTYLNSAIIDKLVRNVDKQFPDLYKIVKTNSKILESQLPIHVTKDMLFTMTLIFQRFILKNRLYDDHKTKIILVTGVPYERLDFYKQQLNEHFNVDYVGHANINSLQTINDLEYDFIFTFSERTCNIVSSKYKRTILTNFFIDIAEEERLKNIGIQEKKTKIIANELLKHINQCKNDEEKIEFLTHAYPNTFI